MKKFPFEESSVDRTVYLSSLGEKLTEKPASRRLVIAGALGTAAVLGSGLGSLSLGYSKTMIPQPKSKSGSSAKAPQRHSVVSISKSSSKTSKLGDHKVRANLKQSLKTNAVSQTKGNILVPRAKGGSQQFAQASNSSPHSLALPKSHRVLNTAGRPTQLEAGVPFNPKRGPLILSRSQNNLRTDSERRISLYNKNTGEKLTAVYWADGDYIPESLMDLNYLLRDFRDDTITSISLGVVDYLYEVREALEYNKMVEVISAYRSPRTNAMLRRNHDGVARNSYHTKGQAIDIVLPGQDLRNVRNAAVKINRGGVGYYAKSNFVHLDSGPLRTWNG